MGGRLFQSTSCGCCYIARARNASASADWVAGAAAEDVLAAIEEGSSAVRGAVAETENVLAAI